ncbi:MAG: HPP family protein [Termitinemataceae bacterium]|nr:MAG: HPP family protein [Termitinemataceae bacterium]
MRIFEKDFHTHWKNYVFQALGAAVFIGLLEFAATSIVNFPIIACFGATMFIITTMPYALSARARNLIGAYICAIASGLLSVFLTSLFPQINTALFAGFAVGLAIFLTCCFSVEHPPAGALAFGLVLSTNPLIASLTSICGIIATAIILHFVRPTMRNLT